jgi:hypothetical protein
MTVIPEMSSFASGRHGFFAEEGELWFVIEHNPRSLSYGV